MAGHSFTSESGRIAGKRAVALHPERRNPVKACVLCLYRVGFGGRTIEKITGTNRSLAIRWAKQSGIARTERKKSRPGILPQSRARLIDRRENNARREELEWEISQQIKIHFTRPPALRRVNTDKERQKLREYYHANKERFAERSREKARRTWLENKDNPQFRLKRRESHKAWVARNRDKVNSYQRGPAAVERRKQYRAQRPKTPMSAEARARITRFHIENPESHRQKAAARKKKKAETLHDQYIKRLLTKGTSLKANEIPQDLIQVKREHLRLMRELKRQTT